MSTLTILRIGASSGLAAGLIAGVVARVAMRLFAIAENMKPSFSLPGTLGVIIIFGVVLGVPLGLIYYRFWQPTSLVGTWRGLSFGVLVLIMLIVLPFMLIPSDEATVTTRLLAILTFIPVPLTYGLALGALAQRWTPAVLA